MPIGHRVKAARDAKDAIENAVPENADELSRLEAEADAVEAALEAEPLFVPPPAQMVTGPTGTTFTFEQMLALFKTATQSTQLTAQQIADIAAGAAAKTRKPENQMAPGISVYSYPDGERDHPKPQLKCRMYMGSAPIERITCTPAEIESLNRMTPGAYRVDKTDGSKAIVEVRGQVNANRQIERMWIVINQEDENKNGYGPTLSWLVDQFTDANRVEAVVA